MTTPLDGASEGRVAIVTGGSRGVGRATIARLAARGYAVVVNYLHDQQCAESTVETVLADHGAAVAVRADVTDELDVQRLFAETIVAFGRVDAVVHAVEGRIIPTPVIDLDLDEFDALCRINTRATLIVNREAARTLRNGGAIVNLSCSAVGVGLAEARRLRGIEGRHRRPHASARHRASGPRHLGQRRVTRCRRTVRAEQDRQHRRAPASAPATA